ncbi:MAG: VWA domain-containing protein [Clostridia bacterium]|nr:VWA domain-containing protein [Clostridia bacterium]
MSWLTPLGFLGLIGIIILIIIYILKPNYQQKFISSTFVWELSLKYRRKKIPINKFKNILLFICQVLVITACAFILAQPIIAENEKPEVLEKVAIIDASASMRSTYNDVTRYERAVSEVSTLAEEVFAENGYMTVIVAGKEASYIAQRATAEDSIEFLSMLEDLVDDDTCTYGKADIEGAVKLAQKVVDANGDTEVLLYTGTEYLAHEGVTVVDVTENGEWNAAILDAEALVEENYYTFKVSVAVYNRDADVIVHCDIKGANGGGTVKMELPVRCNGDETESVSFVTQNSQTAVHEFESVHVYISEDDSFAADNDFYIYGGQKPELKILYYSPNANIFFAGMIMSIRDTLSTRWNIEYKEINVETETAELPVSGYDFYIYENEMPDILPTDGVVMLVNMNKAPDGLPVIMGSEVNGNFNLAYGETHELTNRLTPEKMYLSKYKRLLNYEGFTPLLYCAGDPVLLVQETEEQKVVLMPFSVNFADFSMFVDFPILMYNIFEYFMPSTLTDYAFDVNEKISLEARSESLSVESSTGKKETFEQFPAGLVLTEYGTYTVRQIPMSGVEVVENFFVKIPSSESEINKTLDELYEIIFPVKRENEHLDLLIYFAAALVALLMLERLLQAQDS